MEKTIKIFGSKYIVNRANPVNRFNYNPILTCHNVNKVWLQPHLQVITVHNAGIAIYNNQFHLLFRSHLRNGISIIGLAKSKTGVNDWIISEAPFMKPVIKKDNISGNLNIQELIETEAGGVEDPRICNIENQFYITYSAYHGYYMDKVRVLLAKTKDFESIQRFGPMLDIDMRNVVIFPEKINNKYYALFRPNDDTPGHTGGKFTKILIGFTDDIESNNWEILDKPVIQQTGAPSFFANKIGPGATPIKTKHGWLNIFHGVRKTMDGNPYVLGVALHDLNNPAKVKVSGIPILFPTRADCKVKPTDYVHVPNVVFTCGAVRLDNGTIYIYYGGNDTVLNLGISHEDILAELCKKYPQDPDTGKPLYEM